MNGSIGRGCLERGHRQRRGFDRLRRILFRGRTIRMAAPDDVADPVLVAADRKFVLDRQGAALLANEAKLPFDLHFLKALVICEQLAQRGLDEYKTVHFINEQAAPSAKGNLLPNSVRDGWVTDLAKRVKRCRGQAEAFVKGGYRWLIHAQKP